jgi:outer membrane protein OmpA-like peptidoglycan-associated protein
VETLKVIGYTDRLGSDAYNLKLSQQRAVAVRNYLVSQGVPAEAILTEGRGSTDPKVNCSMRDHEALIACLKPNRRVAIQVIAR